MAERHRLLRWCWRRIVKPWLPDRLAKWLRPNRAGERETMSSFVLHMEAILREVCRLHDRLDQAPAAPTQAVTDRTEGRVGTLQSLPGVEPRMILDPESFDPTMKAPRADDNANALPLELMRHFIHGGDRVVDMGSHVGQFALTAAALGCEVLAIEASPHYAGQLRANARLNGFSNLQVVNCAIGAAPGLAPFCEDGPHGSIASDRVPRPINLCAPVLSAADLLRSLRWDRLALVKLDVEGYEIEALTGLRDFLAGPNAPTLLYESNDHTLNFFRQTTQALHGVVAELGYRIFHVGPRRLTACAPDSVQAFTCADYLAVKGDLPALPEWHIVDQFSEAELVEQFIAELRCPNEDIRASAARRLADANQRLRCHPLVEAGLRTLALDASEQVRSAVAWHARRAA